AKRPTKPEMLKALQSLWRRKSTLRWDLINTAKDLPSGNTFIRHFGSLSAAYNLIGFPHRDCSFLSARRITKGFPEKLCEEICSRIRAVGATAARGSGPGSLMINGNLSAEVMVIFGRTWPDGQTRWPLSINRRRRVDILILTRLDLAKHSILD